jgi:hypothetical protein
MHIQNASTNQAQPRSSELNNETLRELTPEELQQVTGGLKIIAIISILIAL